MNWKGMGEPIGLYRRIMDVYYSDFSDLLKIEKGEKILEFGCGRGDLALHIKSRLDESAGRLFIYDKDRYRLNKAFERAGDDLRIKKIELYADLINLGKGFFDRIVAHFVIHEMEKEIIIRFFKDAAWLLKEGGEFDIKEPLGGKDGVREEEVKKFIADSGFRISESGVYSMPLRGSALFIRAINY